MIQKEFSGRRFLSFESSRLRRKGSRKKIEEVSL